MNRLSFIYHRNLSDPQNIPRWFYFYSISQQLTNEFCIGLNPEFSSNVGGFLLLRSQEKEAAGCSHNSL